MSSDKRIFHKLEPHDIVELINFSPRNLKDFFNKAIQIQDAGVPSYAIINREPMTIVPLDTTMITTADFRHFVKCKND